MLNYSLRIQQWSFFYSCVKNTRIFHIVLQLQHHEEVKIVLYYNCMQSNIINLEMFFVANKKYKETKKALHVATTFNPDFMRKIVRLFVYQCA